MNCKYCDNELRIKRKKIDGNIHHIAYCDECRKKWDLDAKKHSIFPVIVIYAFLLLLITGGIILIVKTIKSNTNDSSTNSELSSDTTNFTQNTIATTESQTLKSFSGLQAYLSEQGIVYGETSEVMYEYIGAKDGIKYIDANIELYEYDISSSAYNEIITTNEINGIPVAAVNGPYILIISNNGVNDSAVTVFKEY